MKRIIFILGLLLCSLGSLYSQSQKQVWLENFDTPASITFTTSATRSGVPWATTTDYAISLPNAYRGRVPNNVGDSVVLETELYDLTSYGFPPNYITLRFKHICKISPMDIVRIEYMQKAGIAEVWKPIPRDLYLGNGNYKSSQTFNARSYTEWSVNDSIAFPTSAWWKEECFDMTSIVNNSETKFRFIIKKGAVLGTDISYGWLVDDFELIITPYELTPPTVEFVSSIPSGTVYTTGPFTINAKVKTNTAAPIKTPYLKYTATPANGIPQTDSILMTNVAGDSLWRATLPQFSEKIPVNYSITGYDTNNNTATISASYITDRFSGSGSVTGEIIIGTGTATMAQAPLWAASGVSLSCSKMLYLGSEFSPRNDGGLITKVAWETTTTQTAPLTNQKCYMMAIDTNRLFTGINPIADGATLVWEGSVHLIPGWIEIELENPFILPAGKNLVVYWQQGHGSTSSATSYFRNSIFTNGSCYASAAITTTGGTLSNNRPNARFYINEGFSDSSAVALTAFVSPQEGGVLGNQPTPIRVLVRNKGLKNLDSVQIHYTVNGGNIISDTYYFDLPCDFEDTADIGFYTPRVNRYDTIVAWVTMPNGVIDTVTFDDTIRVEPYGCLEMNLSNEIIIGSSNQADFASWDDFLFGIKTCGIGGDITLKFESGTYGKMNLRNLDNLTMGHTITITSLTGDKNSVIFASSDTAFVIINASNVVIDAVTIDATEGGSAVYFGTANKITIANSNIYADTSSALANSIHAINKPSNSMLMQNITIKNNVIKGGYYGIGIVGASAYINKDILIDSNIIEGQYYYASHISYAERINYTNNYHTPRVTNQYTLWRGLNMTYVDKSNILGNRIYADNSGLTGIVAGIYAATSMDTVLYANNEIRIKAYGTTTYGIYAFTHIGSQILHNSVLLTGTSSASSRPLAVSTVATNTITVKNNIFLTLDGGPAPYAVHNTSIAGINNGANIFDYNTYYSSGSTFLYAGTAQERLSNWQLIVTSDSNSRVGYPLFTNVANGLALANYDGLNCPLLPNAPNDIENEARPGITTMGCYTRPVTPSGAALTEIVGWQESALLGDNTPVKVVLQNLGTNLLTSITLYYGLNTNTPVQVQKTVNLAYGAIDTIDLTSVSYLQGVNKLIVYVDNLAGDIITSDDTLRVENYTCPGALNGNYTIGANSSNFQTMEEAVFSLERCGINGPVLFEFESGTYSQNITMLQKIEGASDVNTITFTSLSRNYNDVVLQRDDNEDVNGTPVTLENIDHLIFSNLTLSGNFSVEGNVPTSSHGITLKGNCKNIEISNCLIKSYENKYQAYATGQATTISGVNISNANVDNIRILDNRVEGGACGIYIRGVSNTARANNIIIKNNSIPSCDAYGIFAYWAGSIIIENNTIGQRTGNFTLNAMYGIRIDYMTGIINANKINIPTMYGGIYATYVGDTAINNRDTILVSNNEIIGNVSTTSHGGIYFGAFCLAKIYHNSLSIGGLNVRGIQVASNVNTRMFIENNIIKTRSTSADFPIYLSIHDSIRKKGYINNNCYFSEIGTNIGYATTAQTSMPNWISAVPSDVNSVNISPEFANESVHLNLLDTTKLSRDLLVQVPNDINGTARGMLTNMGAYQSEKYSADAVLLKIVSPSGTIVANSPSSIEVLVYNAGIDTIKTLKIGYQANGVVSPTPYTWTGSIAPGQSSAIVVTNNYIPVAGTNTLKVFSYSPNNLTDGDVSNDTLETTVFACGSLPLAAGTYTVGQGGNYAALADAIAILDCNGISGPVVFSILPGEYYENIIISDTIIGSSPTNTITFTSSNNNPDEVYIEGFQHSIQLENTAYLNFRYLTIYGGITAITLSGNGTDIEIYGCKIEINPTGTGTTYRGINYAGSTTSTDKLENVRIIKNHFSQGYYGIHLYGTGISGNNGDNMGYVTIDSNTMENIYYYGIYTSYCRAKSVSYNAIKTRNATSYGITLQSNTVITDGVIGNRINAFTYGLQLVGVNQSSNYGATGKALVANNEIYSTNYGLHLSSNSNVNVYHNSVYVSGGTSTAYGLYFSYSNLTYSADIKNNIFVTIPAVGQNGFAIYAPGALDSQNGSYYLQYAGSFDYNNYYTSTSGLIGRYTYESQYGGTTYNIADLLALRSITRGDDNSVSLLPAFNNVVQDLSLSDVTELNCIRQALVQTDIANTTRPKNTTMGAYAIAPANIDATLVEIIGASAVLANTPVPVSVVVNNAGTTNLTSSMGITITGTLNGNSIGTINYNPSNPLAFDNQDTVSIGSLIFNVGINTLILAINTPGDAILSNDTIWFTGENCLEIIGGEYIIGASSNADYPDWQTFAEATSRCGINDNIILKYEAGTYNGAWELSDLSDILGDYHLTIKSLDEDKDSVIFVDPTEKTALFTLNNVKNFTLDKLTLNASRNRNAVKFAATRSNYNIAITNCNIWTDTASASADTLSVIYKPSSGGELNGILVRNNTITGGSYGVYLYGTSGLSVRNAIVDSNVITKQAYYGIYSYYADSCAYNHNTIISRSTSQTSTVWHGVYHVYGSNVDIVGNRILGYPGITATLRGMTISGFSSDNATKNITITNNEVYLRSNATVGVCGLYVSSAVEHVILHNTVYINWEGAEGSGGPQGAYIGIATASSGVVKNNVFAVNGGLTPYAIYLQGTVANYGNYIANFDIDNNAYYSTGDIGFANNEAQPVLDDWQIIVPSDSNSIDVEPSFNLPQSLEVANFTNFLTDKIVEVEVDVEGKQRNAKTILGAYEHDYLTLDATLSGFVVSLNVGQENVYAVITNMGEDTLRSATIDWSVNSGANTGQVLWTGTPPLATTQSDTFFLGQAIIIPEFNDFEAIVSNVNNSTDLNALNDTLTFRGYACTEILSGDYIIGSSVNADFANMEDAIYVLTTCGVKAPVIMKFESGTYYQNVTLGAIPGSSEVNTITFTSVSGNYADVTLQRNDLSNRSTAPVRLYRTSNIIFNHLSFSGTFKTSGITYSYSHGLIVDASNNIEIHDCSFSVPLFSSMITDAAQNALRLLNRVSNVRIYDNIITGGGYGIYVLGTSNYKASNILIQNNEIKNVDGRGIHVAYTDTVNIINNTVVQRESLPVNASIANGLYGIYLTNTYAKNIVNNKIKANALYAGIYTTSCNNATNATPALIANNEIIGRTKTPAHTGMYFASPTNANVLHNSIAIISDTNTRGVYVANSSATSIKGSIKNNIIAVQTPRVAYPIHVYSTTVANLANVEMNSNNYYDKNRMNIGGVGTTATNITGITSLNAWHSSVASDVASVANEPGFIDPTINLDLKDVVGLVCVMDSLVVTDINGITRDSLTILGAYGVELSQTPDLALQRVIDPPVNSASLCAPYYMPVRYAVFNTSVDVWDYSINPLSLHLEVSGIDLPDFDTVITVNTGQLSVFGVDTIELMDMLNVSYSGIYNIKAWISSVTDTIHKNDTLYASYQSAKIGLPYDDNFSDDELDYRLISDSLVGGFRWAITKSDTIIIPDFGDRKLLFAGTRGSMARLYTSQIELNRTSQPKLEFWYAHDNSNPDLEDVTYVKVSFDGAFTFQWLKTLKRYDANYTSPTWVPYEIDLTPYTDSSCIIIVFESMSYGGIQQIDRIAITSGQNLALDAILTSDYSVCELENKELQVVLSNTINQAVDFDNNPVNLVVQVRGNVVKDTVIALEGTLEALESNTITVYPDFDLALGSCQIKAYLDIDIFDFNRQDDTISRSITITPKFDIEIAKLSIDELALAGFEYEQKITITNTGNMELSDIGLILSVTSDDGTYTFNARDTFNQALQPNAIADFIFNQAYTVPWCENYTVEVHGYLICDSMLFNKNFSVQENVNMVDLKLVSIEKPEDDGAIDIIGTSMEVIVNIQNLSPGKSYTSGEAKAGIMLTDTNGNPVASLPVEGLPTIGSAIMSNASITYIFDGKYTVPNLKEYYLVVYIDGTDQYKQNDTLKLRRSTNAVGTNDLSKVSFTMEQNIPNPAKGNTIINYSIPQDGEIVFKVYSASGQLLYTKEENVPLGEHQIELNLSDYAAGIYFYTMEYKGQRINKRMSITR